MPGLKGQDYCHHLSNVIRGDSANNVGVLKSALMGKPGGAGSTVVVPVMQSGAVSPDGDHRRTAGARGEGRRGMGE